jgi:uncharacterized repeat protein (TIGR03803 family)
VHGSTSGGSGSAQYGALWRYSGSGYEVLRVFGQADGAWPAAPLVQDAAGVLYGTAGGGSGGRGVVFRMQPDGSQYAVLHTFSGDADGGIPRGITFGPDGRLYGVTAAGGTSDEGVVFALGTDGSGFQRLHAFSSAAGEGANPQAPLVLGADGALYGTTNGGGSGGYGTVFRIDAAGAFSTVLSFDYFTNGAYPTAPLVVGTAGRLFGSTPYGGAGDRGTLFQLQADGRVQGVIALDDSAHTVQAGLRPARDGMLYVPSYAGGTAGAGAIVRADPQAFPPPPALLPKVTIYFGQLNPPMTTNTAKVGQVMQLHWVGQHATSCTAGGAWSGRLRPEGIRYVRHMAPGDYAYTLTCRNTSGSATTTSTLHVVP